MNRNLSTMELLSLAVSLFLLSSSSLPFFFFWVGPHSYQLTIEVSVHDRLPTQPYGIYALNTSMIEVPRNSYSNQIVLAVAVSCSITYNRNHHLGAF